MSIFDKARQALEAKLDETIEKSQGTSKAAYEGTKGMVELDFSSSEQYGYKEKQGMLGPQMMKAMRRKNPIVSSIVQTRKSQICNFAFPQEDKYSPGFKIIPREPADLTVEEKYELSDPELRDVNDEEYEKRKHEMEKRLMRRQKQQKEDIAKIEEFILNCGDFREEESGRARMDFKTFLDLLIDDRYTYNYVAIEKIPKKAGGLHSFRPLSAGTIRLVSQSSAKKYSSNILEVIVSNSNFRSDEDKKQMVEKYEGIKEQFRYVQKVRGKIMAAWTDDSLVFKAANPTVDPEDQGYGYGEMEMLLQIITAHLYAEAHNRNMFTQGIASKGILHIKGENISRSQLEAFKRQWLNRGVNSRNAFRPPVIGMSDEVKWIPLTASNREMEYDNWMHYLIKVVCAVFQIDPAEINFDITRAGTNTLNEGNNEQRLKDSRDKGLKPLLLFVENLINRDLLPEWDEDLASKYEFKFVGLDAESRKQEIERIEKEVMTYKPVNQVRKENGFEPIEGGEILLNGAYTQFLQSKMQPEEGQLGDAAGGEDGILQEDEEDVNDILDDTENGLGLDDVIDALDAGEEKDDKPSEDANKSFIEWDFDDEED